MSSTRGVSLKVPNADLPSLNAALVAEYRGLDDRRTVITNALRHGHMKAEEHKGNSMGTYTFDILNHPFISSMALDLLWFLRKFIQVRFGGAGRSFWGVPEGWRRQGKDVYMERFQIDIQHVPNRHPMFQIDIQHVPNRHPWACSK